jgi:hypothetical protein
MSIHEVIAARGLASQEAVAQAVDLQAKDGGALGDRLLDIGAIGSDQRDAIDVSLGFFPARPPRTLAELGLNEGLLLNLLLKFMLLESRERISDLAEAMRLPWRIVDELMGRAGDRKLVQAQGKGGEAHLSEVRYILSEEGRRAAQSALAMNQYVGPAPVSLSDFQAQVERQKISCEVLNDARLRKGLEELVLPEHAMRKLLPAVNAARTILLFGPPGNGKTTVATCIAGLFDQVIHIPHAVEVGGQIMKVFDPALHQPVMGEAERQAVEAQRLVADAGDGRWVACRRPFARVGGELTIEALDLRYDDEARFYDAPLHVKALNGVFLIDDFGRQRLHPKELLNRWIVPMEDRIDFLHLHTGASFTLPFDELLLFSTNIDPQDIMDAAFLRRIPYKILFAAPDKADYRRLFDQTAAAAGLELPDEVFEAVVDLLAERGDFGLASFQPGFICDQVRELARSFSLPPVITRELALEALANLYVQLECEHVRPTTPTPPSFVLSFGTRVGGRQSATQSRRAFGEPAGAESAVAP